MTGYKYIHNDPSGVHSFIPQPQWTLLKRWIFIYFCSLKWRELHAKDADTQPFSRFKVSWVEVCGQFSHKRVKEQLTTSVPGTDRDDHQNCQIQRAGRLNVNSVSTLICWISFMCGLKRWLFWYLDARRSPLAILCAIIIISLVVMTRFGPVKGEHKNNVALFFTSL